jgi:hypothetical protein
MKVRFLIDEDLSLDYAKELRRHDPAIDVLRVGDVGAPSFSTLDRKGLEPAANRRVFTLAVRRPWQKRA